MSDTVVSIDPGLNLCGVALWRAGHLTWARAIARPKDAVDRSDAEIARAMAAEVAMYLPFTEIRLVVIETPTLYRGRSARGDGNDLLRLSMVVGALAALVPVRIPVNAVRPVEHKGNVPKTVTELRARAALSEAELGRVELPAKSLQHNVWDSVWIGLHALGRVHTRG